MPQSYACLQYHLIFSTRDRLPVISPVIRPRLYAYFGGILRSEKGVLLAVGGTADHVHLLAALSREKSVAESLRVIKSNSSRWVHDTFPEVKSFAWQEGYGAFTVGRSGVANIRTYIENQEQHHRTRTFQEEFVEFLKRYEIDYDERYLWG